MTIKDRCLFFLLILVGIILVIYAIAAINHKEATKTPVKEREIEQLEDKHNKIEVEIDSIKHEQKIKIDSVKMYNDSATLILWYELLKS